MLRLIMWSLAAVVLLSGCGTTQQQPKQKPVASVPDESRIKAASRALEPGYKIGRPYRIAGQWYKPAEQFAGTEVGVASWYGPGFHGRTTANGERYDMYAFTAAHKTLQLPSVVRVKNLENGKAVIVRVNDRGPYIDGRVIDLSRKAAEALDLRYSGLANVKLTVLPKESRQLAKWRVRRLDGRYHRRPEPEPARLFDAPATDSRCGQPAVRRALPAGRGILRIGIRRSRSHDAARHRAGGDRADRARRSHAVPGPRRTLW